jgi:hypothetical protein
MLLLRKPVFKLILIRSLGCRHSEINTLDQTTGEKKRGGGTQPASGTGKFW